MEELPEAPCRRAKAYKVLSECYYPPEESLRSLLADCDTSADPLLARLAAAIDQTPDLTALRVDHAKLFVGPYTLLATPYGSVYLEDGKLMGASSLDALRRYGEEGLKTTVNDAPDHVSVELEFVHFLVLKEIEAMTASNPDAAQNFRQKQISFLDDHLGMWILAFAEAVVAHAETPFYKVLAEVTREFIGQDRTALQNEDGAFVNGGSDGAT